MAKVWSITGSGNGFGRDIAEAALAAGDSVVAGTRRTVRAAEAHGYEVAGLRCVTDGQVRVAQRGMIEGIDRHELKPESLPT